MPYYFHTSRDVIARMKFNYLSLVIDDADVYLREGHYSFNYGRRCLFLIMLIGEWLQRHNVPIKAVLRSHTTKFLNEYYSDRGCKKEDIHRTAINTVIKLIRKRFPTPQTHIEREIEQFAVYLKDVCGLRESTIHIHCHNIEGFLRNFFIGKRISIKSLKPVDICNCFQNLSVTPSNSKKVTERSTLSQYFRYLKVNGMKTDSLVNALPTVMRYQKVKSKFVPRENLKTLLKSIDQSSAIGLRTFASIHCMSQLGIRISDVVKMTIDGISLHF